MWTHHHWYVQQTLERCADISRRVGAMAIQHIEGLPPVFMQKVQEDLAYPKAL